VATSTSTTVTSNFVTISGQAFLPWISRGLEGLWLLAVFLVPLIFLSKDYAISEAEIGYIEVPKVALLRTLAGLIAILWSLEWAIKSRSLQGSRPSISLPTIIEKLRPSKAASAIINWLRVHPTRWLLLAAALFFGSTLLSTLLSGSITTSIWGEIPGQDGYSGYSAAAYAVLFAVIATHLKSPAQLGRLLGAVILMGVLVGLYGTLQHYHHDFFGVTETTGGGAARVTIFMGNTIFAAAVLSMTVPLTIVAAAINLHDENWGDSGPLSKLSQLGREYLFTFLWASILAVQLLGLMFTFGRGAWVGMALALVVFLSLLVISLGWRILVRTGLVLGLAAVLSAAFLHWQGSISIINVGEWLGFVMALLGLAGTLAVLFVIKKFGPAIVLIVVLGAIIPVVGAPVLASSALSGHGDDGSTGASTTGGATAAQVTGRIITIKTDVLGGFVGGRGTHWKVSWELIKNRPWFEFDDLSLSWLRPLIGYGPDLFRYTYLLESQPEAYDLRPLEPDHAHNFFIHQTVEQGILGGLVSLMLFASVFGVVTHHILFRRTNGNPVYRLLLFGLMAIIFGRFLEMMVGVARISDLTVLWIIFGLFAASIRFDDRQQEVPVSVAAQPPPRMNRRDRRRAARPSGGQSHNAGLLLRMSVLAFLVGVIGVVTWQKSINYVRASVAEGRALSHFREGDLDSTIEELDKAIKLAPGVPSYYNNRAQVFLNYQLQPDIFTEPGCNGQIEVPYLVCLGLQSLESNLASVAQQPFYYRASIWAANSAFNLQLHESAVESYGNAVGMVPNAWQTRNDLAESQINLGLYEEALSNLARSLEITGLSRAPTQALFLKGTALHGLGQIDDAISALNTGLSWVNPSESETQILALLRRIDAERGVVLDIGFYDREISKKPQDPVAYYFRGRAHLTLGNFVEAQTDIQTSADLGLGKNEMLAYMGYARLKGGDPGRAESPLTSAIGAAPRVALYNAFFGELLLSFDNFAQALNFTDNAKSLDPGLGLPYLIDARIFMATGLEDSARNVLDSLTKREFPTAQDYVDRGEILAFFGEYDLAFSDLDRAILINPDRANFYNARAKTYAIRGRFDSALKDFNTAIEKGETIPAINDFASAQSLGVTEFPQLHDQNAAFFAVYTDTTSPDAEARILLELEAEREELRAAGNSPL